MELTNLSEIKQILKSHNLWAKKFMGQNFLVSTTALSQIVNAANLTKNDHVVEIGPGLGVLTKELCEKAGMVTSIELDKTLLPVLRYTVGGYSNLTIINQDALTVSPPTTPYKVVANIPYNITSPIINHYLQNENKPTSITMLVQKEVAQKIVKYTPDASVISLQIHLFGTPHIVAIVPSKDFYPAPKVDSAIIHIETHNKYNPDIAIKVLTLAKRAFKLSRKKLSNTIPDKLEKLLALGLADKRPQHLSIEDWMELI